MVYHNVCLGNFTHVSIEGDFLLQLCLITLSEYNSVVLGHREKPRACEGSIIAENSCFVSGVPLLAICCSNWFTRACMRALEKRNCSLLSEATRKLFHDVDSVSLILSMWAQKTSTHFLISTEPNRVVSSSSWESSRWFK
jgi:hypothetical protein